MTAERQVGERLSEQIAQEILDDPTTKPVDDETARILARDYLSLARQLAEAERENELLREAANLALVHARAVRMDTAEDEQVRARLVETVEMALGLTANPPDPPASPAEGSEAATEVEA